MQPQLQVWSRISLHIGLSPPITLEQKKLTAKVGFLSGEGWTHHINDSNGLFSRL